MKELNLSYEDLNNMPFEELEWLYDRQTKYLNDKQEAEKSFMSIK